MKKLLWISDTASAPQIGQSVVTREVLCRLTKEYDIVQLGWGDEEVKEGRVPVPFRIIDSKRPDMNDADKLSAIYNKEHPDVIVMSHDFWMYPLVGHMKAKFPEIKQIGYITIDGEPCYPGWRHLAESYDMVVTPTKFAQNTLNHRWLDINTKVVPYGIDHNIFHFPKQGKRALRQVMAAQSGYSQLGRKFFALFIGANQDRKRLPIAHQAWRMFEKGKEQDVFFMMITHSTSMNANVGSWDLVLFLHDTQSLGLIPVPLPVQTVGQFMASADVLLHFADGEGFGLPIAEALACGTVPIIFNFAGSTDFCNSSNSYEVPYMLTPGGYHVNRAIGKIEDCAEAIQKAYTNTEEREAKAKVGMESVKDLTWDNTAKGMKECIDEVLSYDQKKIYAKRIL